MRFFGAEESHWGAVRKYCPNARFLERVDRGVGMSRRIDDVAPVEQRRNARIDLIERADEIADICILWRIEANDLANQHTKVVVECPVCSNTPQCGLPEVDMTVDKARHGNHAAAVYLGHGPTPDVFADRNDLAAVDEQVARLDDPERGIHRNDCRTFDPYSRQHCLHLTFGLGCTIQAALLRRLRASLPLATTVER